MLLYSVNAITSGSTESQGEVTVRLQHGGRVVNGVGADPDIVVASAKAYLSALNKLHSKIGTGRGPGLSRLQRPRQRPDSVASVALEEQRASF